MNRAPWASQASAATEAASARNSSSQVLLAQLHHVHAAGDRGGQEVREVAVAGHAVAHEVQARGRQARTALLAGGVGYGPQVGHRTPV